MQKINNYITEKFKLENNKALDHEIEAPITKEQLIDIIKRELKKTKNANLSFIDTSYITDMSSLFDNLNVGDIYIDNWDVSNVENMDYMFWGNTKFEADISSWDVRKVKSMRHMFEGCKKFNCDLSNWKTESLEKCRGIFDGCDSLKEIPKWSKPF